MTFICGDCKAGHHDQCRGGSWCDCLHRQPKSSHPVSTPQQWGLEQALQAPAWSDQTWKSAMASLGIWHET